jgi:parallel beta helix pectate lyase-like protein
MRSLSTLFAVMGLALSGITKPALSATQQFAVGNCRPSLTSFNTISQAVSTVPSGSTVLVCPGSYPEQVVITQPLTLQGALTGGADAAVITSPGGGVTQNAGSIGALLAVENTGPVNISNIAVDGTNNSATFCFFVGVFYQSSSGTMNHLAVRNIQTPQGCGYAMWIENDSSSTATATVQNSSLHAFDVYGIFVTEGPGGVSATANLLSNSISGGQAGIFIANGTTGATISGNTIEGSASGIDSGIEVDSFGNTVKSNRISGASVAIIVGNANHVLSNLIFDSGTGINAQSGFNQIQSNSISETAGVAISLACGSTSNTVTSNSINEAATGIANNGNSGNTVAPNSFSNTTSVIGPCT